jgi:hypothetical protein
MRHLAMTQNAPPPFQSRIAAADRFIGFREQRASTQTLFPMMNQINLCKSWLLLGFLAAFISGVNSIEGAVPPDNVRPAWIHGWPGDYARLNWDPAPEATSYNIYRFNVAAVTWEMIASGVTDTLAFDYSAGSAGKMYFVTAVGLAGESGPSAIVLTHDDSPVPYFAHSPPDRFAGTLTPTTATFQWAVSLVTGADGMLELSTNAVDFTVVYFNTNYQGAFNVVVSNLLPGTQYTYRLTGVGINRAGTAAALTFWTPPANQPPTAADYTVPQIVDPGPILIPLTGTDPDGNGFPLQFAIVSSPTNGTLSEIYYNDFWGPRYVSYTPNPGARGADSFQYIVNDGELNSAPATVSMPSIWLNRPPQPPSFSTNTLEDVALALDLTAFDPDGDALTYQVFSLNGTVTGTPPHVVYTPNPNLNGLDLLLVYVNDGYTGGFAQGLIQITVAPVNDPPTVNSYAVESPEDTPLSVVLAAWDIEGDPITFPVVTMPAHGVLSGTPPNLIYTPNANFTGTDMFSFRASDGMATSAVASITIIVTPLNDAPVAFNSTVASVEDDFSTPVVLSGADADGDPLTYTIQTPPAHGTLTRLSFFVSYLWRYRPVPNYNGPDSFTFTVSDGVLFSMPATVTINVAPVNDEPVATGQSLTTQEDVALPLTVIASDVDGDVLTYTIDVAPAHGSLSGSGPDYVYTPAANYNGPDQFVFTVTDAAGVTATATNTLTILPVADPPVAIPQTVTTPYNTPANIFLTGSDPDGDLQGFFITGLPENGSLVGTPPWLAFVPDTGFSGTTALQFIARDSTTTSAPVNVTIIVQAATSTPAAPSGLSATVVSSSQIDLTWTDNSGFNEDGFKVERSSGGNSWTQIATVGPSVTTYASTGLNANKSYSYRVRAYNVLGNSAYSATASAKTFK